MEENKKELPLLFWIVMILVATLGAVAIFGMLDKVVPADFEENTAGSGWQELL